MRLSITRKSKLASRRLLRAKLIFNPGSGRMEESPQQLERIISAMQDEQILPEVYSVRPNDHLETVMHNAIKSGIKLIVVAGGDGTVDSVVGAMVGREVTLGIIPTGTRNNVAFSLGITGDIAKAVSLLRQGWRMKIDVGRIHCGHTRFWFLEAVGLGLVSNIYPLADDIQHGDLTVIGGLLSTFVSAEPSRLRIILDGRKRLGVVAHMLLITNMPYLGPRFQISPEVSYRDGRLDLFTFSDVNKLNMISYAMLSQIGFLEDIGIKHYRVKRVKIRSIPSMSVLADGVPLGEGTLSVHVHPRALAVMTGLAPLDKLPPKK